MTYVIPELPELNRSLDVDFWSFEATAGTIVEATLSFQHRGLVLSIFGEDGTKIASTGFGELTVPIPTSGRYFLEVSSNRFIERVPIEYELYLLASESTPLEPTGLTRGNARFEFETPSNPRAASIAGTLRYSSRTSNNIFSLGRIDAGSTITLSTSFPHWSALQPVVEVFGSKHGLVVDSDSSNGTYHGQVSADDDYFAQIYAVEGGGVFAQYVLDAVVDDHGGPRVSNVWGIPPDNEIGTSLIGKIDISFSEDVRLMSEFSDLREAGADQIFDNADDVVYETELIYTYSDVLSVGTIVVKNGPLNDGKYRLTLSSEITDLSGNRLGDGTPFVSSFDIDTNPEFHLFEGFNNDDMPSATFLPMEQDVLGSGISRSVKTGIGILESKEDVDWWRFDANVGPIRITTTTGKSLQRASVSILDDQGQTLTEFTEHSPSFYPIVAIPRAGTYFIRVSQDHRGSIVNLRYSIRLDASTILPLEADEIQNTSSANAEPVPLEFTRDGLHRRSITGTLLVRDTDFFTLGEIPANEQVDLKIDRPQWSGVDPIVSIVPHNSPPIELAADDDGVYRFRTALRGRYDVLLEAKEDDGSAGLNSQYILTATIGDTLPPVVTKVEGIPNDGGRTSHLLSTFNITFSRELDPASVLNADVQLVHTGDDGIFDTSDDRLMRISHDFYKDGSAFSSPRRLQFAVAEGENPLLEGSYRLALPATITSLYGGLLADGNGFSTTFTVNALPSGYQYEGSRNDTRLNATHLVNESPDSRWLNRGIGSMEQAGDSDWWSFDAKAGDWVTVWTPTRSNRALVHTVMFDNDGDVVQKIDQDPTNSQSVSFSRFLIPADGKYDVKIGEEIRSLAGDHLYEIWVHVSEAPGTVSRASGTLNKHFVPTIQGGIAVVAENAQDTHRFQLDGVEPGTRLRVEALAPSWISSSQSIFLVDEFGHFADHQSYDGGILQVSQSPNNGGHLDVVSGSLSPDLDSTHARRSAFIFEVLAYDEAAPRVNVQVQSEGDSHLVRASSVDNDITEVTGTGVEETSLFVLTSGVLRHVRSDQNALIEATILLDGSPTFVGVASDRAKNRTAMDLRSNTIEVIRVDSSLADDPSITLPSRIFLAPNTKLTFDGDWDVLPSVEKGSRLLNRVSARNQVIEFESVTKDQNPVISADVDASGGVSASDALLVINYFNRKDAGSQPLFPSIDGVFLDANGDKTITIADALEIIRWLRVTDVESQPEAEAVALSSLTTAIVCHWALQRVPARGASKGTNLGF